MGGVLVSARPVRRYDHRRHRPAGALPVSAREARARANTPLRIRAIGCELRGRSPLFRFEAQRTATADLEASRRRAMSRHSSRTRSGSPASRHRRRRRPIRARLRALPHAGAESHAIAPRRGQVRRRSSNGWPTLPAARVPVDAAAARPAPRIGGGAVSPERQQAARRRQAEYLGTPINLSAGAQWSYELQDAAAAEGRRDAGHLHRIRPAAADAGSRTTSSWTRTGLAWYASFGEQILGKLDPQHRHGHRVRRSRCSSRTRRPASSACGSTRTRTRGWACSSRAAIAKFDRKTEKFQTWSLPPELNGDHVQINQVSPDRSHVRRQGLAAGCRHLHRPAPRRRVGQVRGLRAVQDSAAQRLRRDSRLAEQRLLPRDGRGGRRPDRRRRPARSRSTRRRRRFRPAPRDDGRRRTASGSARTAPIGSGCSTRGPNVPGMDRADARRLAATT